MIRVVMAMLVVAILIIAAPALADDKSTQPTGVWSREEGDTHVFMFITAKKVELRVIKKNKGTTIIDVPSTYKDGVFSGKVARVRVFKEKFETGMKSSDPLSFKIDIGGDGDATISEVKGKDNAAANETVKKLLEGK